MSIVPTTTPGRVRAPELVGRGGWLNSGGVPLSFARMRGQFVLIDFWNSAGHPVAGVDPHHSASIAAVVVQPRQR